MKQLLRNFIVLFALHLGLLTATPASAQSVYMINHFAGGNGDGGLATRAVLGYVEYIALDSAGNLYIADRENFRVRKLTAASGIITTIAGTGVSGFPKDGDIATSAAIGGIAGLAVDKAGNVFISLDLGVYRVDVGTGVMRRIAGGGSGNPALGGNALSLSILPGALAFNSAGDLFIISGHQVFKLAMATGNLSLYVGDGYLDSAGNGRWAGDGGSALLASLSWPANIAFDAGDNLHIADTGNNVVRKVKASTGIITTVAGNGIGAALGLASGTYSGDGGPATSAGISMPYGLAFDKSGRLYIGDSDNSRVRRVDTAGFITTFAGTGTVFDEADGKQANVTGIANPTGVVVTGSGELLLASQSRYCIRKVATNGIVSTVAGLCANFTNYAGDGGPGATASMSWPERVAVDGTGNVFTNDTRNGNIRRVDGSSGIITTVVGGLYAYGDVTPGDDGWLGTQVAVKPAGLTTDSSGNLYYADWCRVRKWQATTGTVTTLAGDPQYSSTCGLSGDGGIGTKALFGEVGDIVVDHSGNLFVAANGRVRKLAVSTGIVKTVAGTGNSGYSGDGGPATSATFGTISGLAVDSKNNLYIADEVGVVRKVDAAGIITTFAGDYAKRDVYGTGNFGDGGLATAASFYTPKGIAFDSADNLYIVDRGHQRIRRVDAATKIISTVTGLGSAGNSGDGGLASLASVNYPVGIAVDKSNNIFVADTYNNSIRKIAMPQAVVAVPVCKLTASPPVTAAGSPSTLTASCTPAATSYTWTGASFGASASSGVVNPSKPTLYSVVGSNSVGSGLAASAAVYVCNTPPSQNYPGLILTGTQPNAPLYSGIGNDTINGGPGFDSVVYQCNKSSFTITKTTTGWTVSSAAEGIDTLTNVTRIQFGNETLALDISGVAGQAYRIYQAAFSRVPDNGGLKYWIAQMDAGMNQLEVAARFVDSAEFRALYGTNPTNADFLTRLYSNVLHRTPDAGGYAWWLGELDAGRYNKVTALAGFSESPENQAGVLNAIINGIDLLN